MRRALIIIFGGVLPVGVLLAYYGARWAENKIEQEIKAISFLSFDSLSIDIADRSLKLFNVKGDKAGYRGEIELLEIQGLQLIPVLKRKEFIVKSVSVKGLSLEYQLKPLSKKDKDSTAVKQPKTDDLPVFSIGEINVDEAFFTISDEQKKRVFSTKIAASLLDLTKEDILSPRTIPAKLNRLTLDSAIYLINNGLYNMRVFKAEYDSDQLAITGISLESSKGKYELGNYIGHEIEWFNATVDSIKMNLPDMGSLLNHPKVKKMKIYQPSLKAFRDKRLPFPKDQHPPLVRDILANSDITFSFDSIAIVNGSIEYEVFVKEEKGPGSISFNELNATMTGMSSYSLGLQQKPRLIANCKLYGKSNLYADVSFPASPQSNDTWVKGKLLNTDLTIFNRMIQYVSVIEIKSGKSEFLEFDFIHNNSTSTGEMKFAYTDLEVSFLKQQESEPNGFFNTFKSFFVNSFVIDSNNNFDTDKFRVGKIDFKRDSEKSIFNFWSGSILSGFKSSTGVDATGEKIDVN